VLIPKGKGRRETAEAYRTLMLLPAIGKIFEKCILKRIEQRNEECISKKQYGFRKGRSCEDCITTVVHNLEKMRNSSKIAAEISLDIKGAFDHLEWGSLKKGVYSNYPRCYANVINSYLSDRKIKYHSATATLERGCPQSGVLSGSIWNLGYNPVLKFLEKS